MKKYNAITLGEALIDYIPLTQRVCGEYRATVGGAPLNVAVGLSRLMDNVGIIARVGADPLGFEIIKALENAGIDCSFVQVDAKRHTPVTVVMPNASDMMRYIIYRENTSDNGIDIQEVPSSVFSDTYLLHIGTLLSSKTHAEQNVLEAIHLAKQGGAKISLDVNIRLGCWDSKEEMRRVALSLVAKADIIKVTKDELETLGINPADYAHGGKILIVTNAAEDAYAYWKGHVISQAVPKVTTVDVTGAGDAFLAAFLYQYVQYLKSEDSFDVEKLAKCMALGVKAGAYAVQGYGTHESYPSRVRLLGPR